MNNGEIAVRDSKDPDFHLCFTVEEAGAFINRIKCGEYDHLVDPRV